MGLKLSSREGLHEPAYHVQYIGPLRIESNADVDDPLRQPGVNPFYRAPSTKTMFQGRWGVLGILDLHIYISKFLTLSVI